MRKRRSEPRRSYAVYLGNDRIWTVTAEDWHAASDLASEVTGVPRDELYLTDVDALVQAKGVRLG